MRGSTPLDVAASSVMDNNGLALALEEPDLDKVGLLVSCHSVKVGLSDSKTKRDYGLIHIKQINLPYICHYIMKTTLFICRWLHTWLDVVYRAVRCFSLKGTQTLAGTP